MAEVVLATALALPVIFAFAELRGTWLAGTATTPQLADTPPDSSETPAAERQLPSKVQVLEGGSIEGFSTWGPRVAVLRVGPSSTARDASVNAVDTQLEPGTVDAYKPVETTAEGASLTRKDGRLIRPSPARVSETPSEPMQ
jgi:hypothetical protein